MNKNFIKDCIADNNPHRAIVELKKLIPEDDSELMNQIIKLEGDLKDCFHSFRKGIIALDERDLKLSKVNIFLLEIADEYFRNQKNSTHHKTLTIIENPKNHKSEVIEIPKKLYDSLDNSDLIYVEFLLEFKETQKIVNILSPDKLSTGLIATHIVATTFPELKKQNYEWYLIANDKKVPLYHTLFSANIANGDKVNLAGQHRIPQIHFYNEKRPSLMRRIKRKINNYWQKITPTINTKNKIPKDKVWESKDFSEILKKINERNKKINEW